MGTSGDLCSFCRIVVPCPPPPLTHASYSTLSNSMYRDPNEATLFFVPLYTKCVALMKDLEKIRNYENLLKKFLSETPYFARSGGRDHMFVFPSGIGPNFLKVSLYSSKKQPPSYFPRH